MLTHQYHIHRKDLERDATRRCHIITRVYLSKVSMHGVLRFLGDKATIKTV